MAAVPRNRFDVSTFPVHLAESIRSKITVQSNRVSTLKRTMSPWCEPERFAKPSADEAVELSSISCVDLFCGVGGLTHGLVLEGIRVAVGIDLDGACRFPYESNNQARFIERDVGDLTAGELREFLGDAPVTVLAGCAPCQPFSTYAQRYPLRTEGKWGLLYEFARLAEETSASLVTMENVPSVARHRVFRDFVGTLERLGYQVWFDVVDSSLYGVPQTRRRMVLLASRRGRIEMIDPTTPEPKTVRNTIGRLAPIEAGQSSGLDRLHASSRLSDKNLQRIRASKPGGTWRDWPSDLVADCHASDTGKSYPSVYGRMEWDKPAPTITTQCHGFGNGRFGHPEQDRAISLREAALLQSFPDDYAFIEDDDDVNFSTLGRLIGNAVPVELGRAIGRSIREHVRTTSICDAASSTG